MIPSPAELKYFIEVANTLNMSRAAERLGISQPALTLAIQRLEHSFGQPVLIRSKTGVRLTRGGSKLVSKARFLMQEWEKIREESDADSKEIRGTYSIGCHPSVALYTLPFFVKDLIEEHPDLELKFQHDLSRKITEEVISCKIDFGLVINPTSHPDLVLTHLLDDEVKFWVGPQKSNLQKAKDGELPLICDMDLLQVQSLLKQLRRKGFRFNQTMTSSNLEVITSLVASGAGVGILPSRVAQKTKSMNLKPLDESLPKFHDKCYLIYRADTQKSPASRLLIDFIKSRLKDKK